MHAAGRIFILAAILAGTAEATDRHVDASGASGPYTDITQAMVASSPGDRILVHPGTYSAFHFSRGVEVIGLGTRPSDVVVARVDFHVTVPIIDFHAALANLTISGSGAQNSISLGGNELSRGVLVIDSVAMTGGVFLHGVGGLYAMMLNSRVEPSAGGGFMNAALDFGGGTMDIVESRLKAASASFLLGTPAGVALRVGSGSAHVRLSGSEILGGAGDEGSANWNGGDAIQQPSGSAGPVLLRLSGGTVVDGGDAWGGGAGGAGIDVSGSIVTGTASVQGGAGGSPGSPYADAQPVALGYDPELRLAPAHPFAEGDAFVRPGGGYVLQLDPSIPDPRVYESVVLTPILGANASPLPPGQSVFVADPSLGVLVPGRVGPVTDQAPRRRHYFQALLRDPLTRLAVSTNPVAVTVDP